MLLMFKVKNYTSFKEEAILDMRATSVSYTHLDVYKRQAIWRADGAIIRNHSEGNRSCCSMRTAV